MNNYLFTTFILGLWISLFSFSPEQATLSALVNRYKRPLTILEICPNKIHHSLSLAAYPHVTCVALMLSEPHAIYYQYNRTLPANFILLNPSSLIPEDITQLGRCEHFDIVIVHDIFQKNFECTPQLLRSLLNLGDHLFLSLPAPLLIDQVPEQPVECICTPLQTTYHWHISKTSIDVPRWIMKKRKKDTPPYTIHSTFSEKQLIKLDQQTEWIPGINLVTFFMLNGIYPTVETLKSKLLTLKNIDHNDLILGNIIIQGDKIIPIDFNDHRGGTAKKCIQTACFFLKLLNSGMPAEIALHEYERRLLQLFPKKTNTKKT